MNPFKNHSESFSQTQEESQSFWQKKVFKSPLLPKPQPQPQPQAIAVPKFIAPASSQSRKRNQSDVMIQGMNQEDEENAIEEALLVSSEPEKKRQRSTRVINGSTSSPIYSKPFASSSSPLRTKNSSSPPTFDREKSLAEQQEVKLELTPLQKALVKYNQKLKSKPTWATEREINAEKESEREVARLTTKRGGRTQVLALQLNKPFVVGRHWRCDYVIPDPRVSAYHFKLFAHLTDSGDIFVVLEDTSRNGILWNGNRCHGKSVILSDGDKIQIPKSQVFQYAHIINEFERVGENLLENTMTVDKYILLNRILGTGSYAKVFLAYDTVSSRQVACKRQTIPKEDKTAKKNLMREIELLKQMHHPNINRLFDQIEDEDHVYLFVNLVAGGDLFNYVSKHRRLADAEAKFITYQILLAVQYLHNQGIAHRDLKPENVLLLTTGIDRFPHIQLGDFGLAFKGEVKQSTTSQFVPAAAKKSRGRQRKGASSPSDLEKIETVEVRDKDSKDQIAAVKKARRRPGKDASEKSSLEKIGNVEVNIRASSTCGTVSYLPPEAFIIRVTEETYDPLKVDIWGIGCILFVMLCGCHPFDHHSVDTPEDINHMIRARLILDSIYPHSFFEKKLKTSEMQGLEYMLEYCKRKEDFKKGLISNSSFEATESQEDQEARFGHKYELITNVIQIKWKIHSVLPADPQGNGGTNLHFKGKGKGKDKLKEGVKKEAFELISSIFQFEPSSRPSCKGIFESIWINQSMKELQNLYQAKVSGF